MSTGLWTAGQVARELGVPEPTLRSWHRRYDLGPSDHVPGRYRRYTSKDVDRLRRMRDLIQAGMLASEAARTVNTDPPLPLDQAVSQTVQAARALDTARCTLVLEQALRDWGVVTAWEGVCRPALVAIDADQRTDPHCVDTEHALSWAITAALHRHPPLPAQTPHVLLACTETEQHTLALEALAAALADRGIAARMLGATTPQPALLRATTATAPAAVVLWAHQRTTAQPDTLRALATHPNVRRITAGPGWPTRRPSGTWHAASLQEALELLSMHR
jgi:DNA-binding transcriptional MerR regulator